MNEVTENLSELLKKFAPLEYKGLIFGTELMRLYLVSNKKREHVLHDLELHQQSVEEHNISVLGMKELINKLKIINNKSINIICGFNFVYAFEIYLDSELNNRIGFIIVKIRKKSDEEIKTEMEVFGIEVPISEDY
jgi:FAD synthase